MDFIRKAFSQQMLFDNEDLEEVSKYFTDLFKTIIIGDSGVGKTSLMRRLCASEFNEEYIPTIGVDFCVKYVNIFSERPRLIKLQVWDTSGADRFSEVRNSYIRGSYVILVFDVTNEQSFQRIRSYWFSFVSSSRSSSHTCILIGNKCDLKAKRVVSINQGIDMARELGIDNYLDVSAKVGTNVDESFASLVYGILE